MDGTTVSVSALGRIPPKNYHASAAGISPASTVSTASSRTTHSQPQPAQVQAQAQAQALGQGQSHAKSPLNHHHRYQPSQRVLSSVLATRQSQSRTANAQSHDSSSNNNHNNKKNASDTTASPYRPRSLFAAPLSQSTFASTTSTTATTHAPVGRMTSRNNRHRNHCSARLPPRGKLHRRPSEHHQPSQGTLQWP